MTRDSTTEHTKCQPRMVNPNRVQTYLDRLLGLWLAIASIKGRHSERLVANLRTTARER